MSREPSSPALGIGSWTNSRNKRSPSSPRSSRATDGHVRLFDGFNTCGGRWLPPRCRRNAKGGRGAAIRSAYALALRRDLAVASRECFREKRRRDRRPPAPKTRSAIREIPNVSFGPENAGL